MATGKSNGQGAVTGEGFVKEARSIQAKPAKMDYSLCKRWYQSGLLMQATDTQAKLAKTELEFWFA